MIRGVVGILRSSEPVDLLATCRALHTGGVAILEITLNTSGALESIQAARGEFGNAVTVGAGTILRPADAIAAIQAGAEFIVTPTLQLDTVALCRERGVPILCGAMTPTEIFAAHEAGADYVKLFPANSLGLDYIKSVLAPLPFVRFVPTGGVSLDNIGSFLKVCPAVGVGSSLVDLKLVKESRWEELTALARKFVAAAGAAS